MMENELFKIAFEFLKKEQLIGLYLAYDIGEKIVFFGGNPDEPYYGCRSVAVNKKSKQCNWFIIETNEDNEKILDNAEEIKIPEEYSYTAQRG